jgi:protoporphyrinogen oxidase
MTGAGPHWGIIGGGMLGMTLALRLRGQGRRVTVLEAGESLGGLAAPWQIGDVTWDRHYHVILQSDAHLLGLLAELGLADELCWTTTRTGFYTGGRLHSMSSALEFLTFPPLDPVEKLRLAITILHASRIRDWRPLERVAVADWLRRWSGRGTTEKIWLPLLRAKLGDAYQRTSAAFIWATIQRMYAARRSGLKQERFGYVRGGYARILDRFAVVLGERGVEIVLRAPVRRVAAAVGGGVEADLGTGAVRRFDGVVITAPAAVAARMCPDLRPDESERLRGIEYLGIVCASALLKRPLSPYYITNITEPWVPFTAVIEMSALVAPDQLGGHALVYLPRYAAADAPVFSRSDAEIEAEFLAALRRMHPSLAADDVLAFRVSRVPHVFALPTLGYSDSLPGTATSIPGVHVVNSAHIVNGTLNVNETVQLADRAAAELP